MNADGVGHRRAHRAKGNEYAGPNGPLPSQELEPGGQPDTQGGKDDARLRLIIIPVVMRPLVPIMMAPFVRSGMSTVMVAIPRIPVCAAVPTEMTAGMFVMMPTAMPVVVPWGTPIVVSPVAVGARLCLGRKAN